MSVSRLLPAALLVLAVGAGPSQAGVSLDSAAPAAGSAAHAALVELESQFGASAAATAQVSRFGGSSLWETGTLALPATDSGGTIVSPDEPRVFLYVAQRTGNGWSVALEGTERFALLAEQGHATLAEGGGGDLLGTVGPTPPIGGPDSSSASLSLPWRAGESWRLTGGPHSHSGRPPKPWSALDFAGPRRGSSMEVLAARSGIVLRPCDNLVQIRHGSGWTTSYYHLKDISVQAGQSVERGTPLGYTSTAAGCGGAATGAHVHFSVLRNGSHINLDGLAIGGWTVRAANKPYAGCLAKGSTVRCASGGSIYNSGSAGSAP